MSGFKRLNLVPLSTRFELVLRTQLRRWAGRIGFVLCGLGVITLWQASETHSSAIERQQKELLYQPVRDMMSSNSTISQQLKEFERQRIELENLVAGTTPLHILKAIAVASHHASGQIVVTNLSCNSQDVEEKLAVKQTTASAPKQKITRTGFVTMSGSGEDDESIMEFISALKQSGLFVKVELKSASHSKAQDQTTKQFLIEAQSEIEVAS